MRDPSSCSLLLFGVVMRPTCSLTNHTRTLHNHDHTGRLAPLRPARRAAAPAPRAAQPGAGGAGAGAGSAAPADALRREKAALEAAVADAAGAVGALEGELASLGAAVPPRPSAAATAAPLDPSQMQPEDFWSPAVEVPDGVEYVDEYGAISPVPDHDGTACFKWDETLWAKADHFRVSWLAWRGGGGGRGCCVLDRQRRPT